MSTRDHDFDPEDLAARARSGVLSRAEQDALAHALRQDPALETAYRVGCEIDRESAVQAGDDALIARAAEAAIARGAELTAQPRAARNRLGARSGSRLAAAAAVALSILCASGIAAAWWSGVVVSWPFALAPRASEPAAAPAERPKHNARPKRVLAEPAQPPLPQVTASAPMLEPVVEPVVEQKAPSAPSASVRKRGEAPDAAELFHAANAARRSGELARARRLYATLISEQARSDEARVARVSLGKLLLAAGDARAAERELRRYLSAGPGQLEEEALVGLAQSLGSLRRSDEERATWQRLLVGHPGSVYAAQAKQRIGALDESKP